mgnify:CR=1 FL=1
MRDTPLSLDIIFVQAASGDVVTQASTSVVAGSSLHVEAQSIEEGAKEPVIIKTKSFSMKPMSSTPSEIAGSQHPPPAFHEGTCTLLTLLTLCEADLFQEPAKRNGPGPSRGRAGAVRTCSWSGQALRSMQMSPGAFGLFCSALGIGIVTSGPYDASFLW